MFSISSVQAKDFDFCERVGILNAIYLSEIPPRLVIYDVSFSLAPSLPIYKVSKGSKSDKYERVGVDDLETGTTLSYKVDDTSVKRQPKIQELWILPHGHCRSSE